MRDAVEEVGGAVDRIDDPPRLGRIARDGAAFLKMEAPVGPGVAEFLYQRLLGALVGHRDKVCRSLSADLKLLDLAEVSAMRGAALRAARCMTVMRPEWETINLPMSA
jgi:hypothetical protein